MKVRGTFQHKVKGGTVPNKLSGRAVIGQERTKSMKSVLAFNMPHKNSLNALHVRLGSKLLGLLYFQEGTCACGDEFYECARIACIRTYVFQHLLSLDGFCMWSVGL
jgi:hypothetical protein